VMLYEWRKKAKRFIKMSFKRVTKKKTHDRMKEILWTIFPTFILIAIAIPSIKLLYSMDTLVLTGEPVYTYKIIGHQWFWSYEYFTIINQVTFAVEQGLFLGKFPAFGKVGQPITMHLSNYSSYMLDEEAVHRIKGGLRLLEVDNPLFVPTLTCLRFLITSVDVLHSWAVPSLGIKVDAVPGRLNQVYTLIKRPSTFYGQCSEICGINHGFMPIKVVAYNQPDISMGRYFVNRALDDMQAFYESCIAKGGSCGCNS
jgi:cytochrome c oxidase subunit 2